MNFIIVFILLVNVISIALTYFALGKRTQKQKLIFIAIGLAVNYMLVSLVYGLSGIGNANKNLIDAVKDYLVLTFVPVNSIVVLPVLARTWRNYTDKKIDENKVKERCIMLVIVLVIGLIVEFFYFRNIQGGILEIIKQKQENKPAISNSVTLQNETNEEVGENVLVNNTVTQNREETNNQITNYEKVNNVVSNNIVVNQE